ncbi:dUTP diphosphatase [Mycoplasma sp. Mirounga ES2805-ORL]|uniref:dUTP diphosphatase n=1 Tax=Mycoplasma sp. Mirounga ES2805-ORL TaxID=754514 RepID=UPI00197B9C3A|nr:dUTP diphosphatase [Mycoplasma sp. Mirounga ES2805-ORL]QSF13782.1 dUTP diphosphatase [Mycoplasma sp. Mirounga ES2805-ORL]
MNFSRIYEMQKKLDAAYTIDPKITEDKIGFFHKRLLALLVEVGEFANEIQTFKYWKKHKNVDMKKVSEEFADVMHFQTSLAYRLGASEIIEPLILDEDINLQLIKYYRLIVNLMEDLSKEKIEEVLSVSIALAHMVGIDDQQIFDNYEAKNKINYERIRNNY